MFRIGALLLIIIAIAAAATNPGEADHKKVVLEKMTAQAGVDGLMGQVANSVLGELDVVPVEYHNYVFFSTSTVRDKTTSIGFLRMVRATEGDNPSEKDS